MKKYREFTVTPGMAGFKVKIGCSEVYFGDAKSLDLAISAYLKDPEAMEKKMTAGDIRNRQPNGAVVSGASLSIGSGGSMWATQPSANAVARG